MIPQHDNTLSIDGTGFRGVIKADYHDLVDVFGEPDKECDGTKLDRQWILQFENGTIVTIYNWKDGPNYLRLAGLDPEKIIDWHIGGKTTDAICLVEGALEIKTLLLQ
jgi:hypothetical protein